MTDPIGSIGLLIVVSATIFGPLTGWFAGRRDRHPVVWLLFGALLGPIALVLVATAPPGRCPLCDSQVFGWPRSCAVCGGPFREVGPAWSGRIQEPEAPGVAAPADGTPGRTFGSADPAPTERSTAPIPLPVGRAARTRRVERGPDAEPRPAFSTERGGERLTHGSDHAAIDPGEVLATAVYFGGTARLVVGSRYVIVRHDAVLRLLGPVDRDPSAVALERPLANLTATAIGERLVITEGPEERVSLALALGAFAGASGPQLEVALAVRDDRAGDRWPASG